MFKKVFHIVIAALILVSSTGFSVNMHFCHEHLIDMALNVPAENCCGGDDDMLVCCTIAVQPENNHCEDKSISVKTSGEYVTTVYHFNFDDSFSFDLPWLTYPDLFTVNNDNQSTFAFAELRSPPGIPGVSLPQIQSFLL
ncbi:MAG: hypothetical protein K9J30_02805 [Bacteroidales bacterium]|nr:hypothetical protein [Bacteroidales bacterium]